jgi:hypothetical protein
VFEMQISHVNELQYGYERHNSILQDVVDFQAVLLC